MKAGFSEAGNTDKVDKSEDFCILAFFLILNKNV